MAWWYASLWGIVGLAVGSFLNVLIYRVPKKLPFVHQRSRCSQCENQLRWFDLIPVVSFVLLGGKCRSCKSRISVRYPIVEIVTGLSFFWVVRVHGNGLEVLSFLIFAAALITISAIDFELYIIPNRIVYPAGYACLAALTAAAAIDGSWHQLRDAALGSVGAWLVLLVIHLISPRGMGFGDVRLAALIGLNTGWISPLRTYLALMLGFAAGAVVGVLLIVIGRAGRRTAIPFGPYLAIGGFLALFIGFPTR